VFSSLDSRITLPEFHPHYGFGDPPCLPVHPSRRKPIAGLSINREDNFTRTPIPEVAMSTVSISAATHKTGLVLPILVGGGIAGLLDMTSAYISFGRYMPIGIAGGVVGAAGRHVSAGQYILGLSIHYLIAFSAAAAYCLVSKKLDFLRDHFVVCGIFYGIGFFLFMQLVVLPLSAYHAMGPYQYRGLVQGLLAHIFLIGLPISASLRLLSK
jgi:hypothetical protein